MFFNKSHSIFVAAHPDDIELFMFKSLINAIKNNHEITIIILTAGDDNKGFENGNSNAYWRLRVNGQEKALKFLTHRVHGILKNEKYYHDHFLMVNFNQISLINLMLPDSNTSSKTGSLTQLCALENGLIGQIKTIDHCTTYTKSQIIKKIQDIIAERSRFSRFKYLHITSLSANNNNDHPDHQTASKWASEATNSFIKSSNTISYQTYNNVYEKINFTIEELQLHSATWGIYNSQILEYYPDLSGRLQLSYLGKEYKLS